MGTFSIWHWLIVLVVVLILFGGKGKISQIMGDVGKGLKSFKKSLREEDGQAAEDDGAATPPKALRAGADQSLDSTVRERDQAAKS
ncbi:MAG: twin-arginine translocase TatA/TatE family subunit [Rhodospirillales bacterium]|nr:MAG: twin-arginine translocase TatA/TatE family subunit [Rhodospirillales bacterium]